ncbi:regulatory protein RecX [Nocardioides perillae]|uniref:Regulatory protein RecX n=1 Tax=Nocardioides perillae TaxID=1119534 RepID=A0A7Y9UL73_9ACTN|nr:regulatory protein RecX [Nocardioides perillae]NYG56143.1 regulatory protein [Nocardioides perillae]
MQPEQRPAPDWVGDVTAGVDAWTASAPPTEVASQRRARGARRSAPPPDTAALGPDADPEQVARTILLDQLTGRARSRHELAERLARKGVPDDVGSRLLDRFEEVGLVDDEAFARAWVDQRQSGKGLARRALAQELRRKGVDDEVAREVLDEVDPEAEHDAARRLVQRRLRSVARLDRATATRRLVAMLGRKGHPPGVAFAVVREELDAAGHGSDEVGDLGDTDDLGGTGDLVD